VEIRAEKILSSNETYDYKDTESPDYEFMKHGSIFSLIVYRILLINLCFGSVCRRNVDLSA